MCEIRPHGQGHGRGQCSVSSHPLPVSVELSFVEDLCAISRMASQGVLLVGVPMGFQRRRAEVV